MNTKKLKQLVLDLAIHGKLVPQDPNDEPAGELLKRIQADVETRGRASNKSKGKKSAVSSVDLDEVPFEVPSSWSWTQLGNVITVKSGDSLKVRTAVAGNYPIYGGNGINGYCDSFNVNEQTVLIGRVGFYCGSVHKTLMKSWVTDNALIVNYYDVFFVDYLYWLLSWMNLGSTSNSTAQPVVSGKGILPLFIPLPPLAEQHRIVAAIEKWFAVIDQLEKNEADLRKSIEQTKKKVLDLAIRGKLVAQNPEDEPAGELLARIRAERENKVKSKQIKLSKPEKFFKMEDIPSEFDLPFNWDWCCINDICRVFGRIGFRGYTKQDLVETKELGAISLSPSNMKDGKLDFSECSFLSNEKYEESPEIMVTEGDVLLVKTASVGKTALVRHLPWKATINPQIAILKDVSIDKEFFSYMLLSSYAQEKFQGYAIGTAVPTFSQEKLLGFIFPLPPLAEQHRIVEKIEEVFGVLENVLY